MAQSTIAITMGDYNGIGPEIALKSILSPAVKKACRPVLVGSIDVFEYYVRRFRLRLHLQETRLENLSVDSKRIQVVDVGPSEKPVVHPGTQTTLAARWAGAAITTAVESCVSAIFDGMVTAPVSKSSMIAARYSYPGQTEMVSALSGHSSATMMLVAGEFRIGLATVHIPVSHISQHITTRLIVDRLLALHRTLIDDFNIRSPKIAVLGLNPHAGEQGVLGKEELTIIGPAITRARLKHIRAEGPFPADGFFGTQSHRKYDAVLAMYHDQGLIPLKMSGFDIGVNYSAGLPIVRTSPDHGTAYSIAGKGIASARSMIEAIRLASKIIHNRRKRRHD